MVLDDYDDLNRFLTGDGRSWCTRTFASSVVYRYRSCLQDDASPAESQIDRCQRQASLMVHTSLSRMDITICACHIVQNGYNDFKDDYSYVFIEIIPWL